MSAEVTIKLGLKGEALRAECARLMEEIEQRRAEIELFRAALGAYQKSCKHPGQQVGYNERDGDWANPCPVCGESH